MTLQFADLVKATTATTGTDDLVIAALAPTGYTTPDTSITDGQTVHYHIWNGNRSEYEVGEGIVTGTTLTRVTVRKSSAGAPTKTTFTAGQKTVLLGVNANWYQTVEDFIQASTLVSDLVTVVGTISAGVWQGSVIDAAYLDVSGGGWMDDGTTVRLTTITDDVAIGTATPIDSAKFSVDGESDQIQGIFRANSGQSVDTFVVRADDDTDWLTVDSTGSTTLSQSLTVAGTNVSFTGDDVVLGLGMTNPVVISHDSVAGKLTLAGVYFQFTGSDSLGIPTGSTAQRVDNANSIRVNTDTNNLELYTDSAWRDVGPHYDRVFDPSEVVADNGVAMIAAINAAPSGSRFYLKQGTYNLSGTGPIILEGKNNILIEGAGMQDTILDFGLTGSNNHCIQLSGAQHVLRDFRVQTTSVPGPNTGHIFRLYSTTVEGISECLIERVHCRQNRWSSHVLYHENGEISGLWFNYCQFNHQGVAVGTPADRSMFEFFEDESASPSNVRAHVLSWHSCRFNNGAGEHVFRFNSVSPGITASSTVEWVNNTFHTCMGGILYTESGRSMRFDGAWIGDANGAYTNHKFSLNPGYGGSDYAKYCGIVISNTTLGDTDATMGANMDIYYNSAENFGLLTLINLWTQEFNATQAIRVDYENARGVTEINCKGITVRNNALRAQIIGPECHEQFIIGDGNFLLQNQFASAAAKNATMRTENYVGGAADWHWISVAALASGNFMDIGGTGVTGRTHAQQVSFYIADTNLNETATRKFNITNTQLLVENLDNFDIFDVDIAVGTDRADASDKFGHFNSPHYTAAEEDINFIQFSVGVSGNVLNFGGGGAGAIYNQPTEINLYTSDTNTNLSATRRLSLTDTQLLIENLDDLDISGVNVNIIGQDLAIGTSRTDATDKFGHINSPHYTAAEEDINCIQFISTTSSNVVRIGGGGAGATYNQPTVIEFFIGSSTTDLSATKMVDIDSDGATFYGTAGAVIPTGTTGERVATEGRLRINSTDGTTEIYRNAGWVDLEASAAGAVTALNNQAENRLVTIGATTTQLDGEVSTTFDGTTLTLATDDGAIVLGTTNTVTLTHISATKELSVDGSIYSTATNGPKLAHEVPSATNPTLIPGRADLTTGVGTSGAGVVTLVANSVNMVQVDTTTTFGGTSGIVLPSGNNSTERVTTEGMLRVNSTDGTTEIYRGAAWRDLESGGGDVATDTIWDAAEDLVVGSGADTAVRLPVGGEGTVLTVTSGAVTWTAPAGGGNVTAVGTPVNSDIGVWTGSTTIEGTVDANHTFQYDGSDVTHYEAVNDGNPQLRIGATDAEELHVQTVYDSVAQTLDYVLFSTDVASATADKGAYRFSVDGTEILHINDDGLDLVTSGDSYSIEGTSVLSATTLGSGVTGSSLTSVAEAAVTAHQAALTGTGALNSGSITSGFGNIDIGASTFDTSGAVSTGVITSTSLNLTADSNQIVLDSDAGAGVTTTITDSASAARVITLPDATDTLVGKATTDTLTNKTFDANGTGNALSNVDVADLANGTAGELITWSAGGVATVVAAGNSSEVLTSNGAGAAPTFQPSAGGGNVSNTGTPVDGQISVWTDATTVEGDAALTFDTTTDSLVIAASGNLLFGAVTILDDAAGTTTLSNIDAIDATTEATIETAIDTLANLTTTGALNAGSITSGFGAIDIGSSTFDTTGAVSTGVITSTSINLTANSNQIVLDSDAGAGVTTTITDSASAARVITLPDATDTLVGKATTDTLTNKTFDANGTGNSLSNVDVADLSNGTAGQLITWSAGGVATVVAAGSSSEVLTSNGAGAAPTFQPAAGGGNVSNTGTPVDGQLAVWTDATTVEGDPHLTFTANSDFAIYEDVDDGNPTISVGSSAAERVQIQTVFDSVAQTLDYVKYSTAAASASANKGLHRFDVDGTDIVDINDSGVDVKSGLDFLINGTSVLNATTIGSAVVSSSLTSVGTITSGVWTGTDINVADGGTGRGTATEYAVLCGGTTTTGAHQSIADVGTVGQVLTSNGAGALPTFQAAGAADNLGDHTATESLKMASFAIDNAGVITGTSLNLTGDTNQITLDSDGTFSTILTASATGSTKTITFPDATGTLLYSGGPLGTPSSGTLDSCTFNSLDATTEATIEAAIDTLANLTSFGTAATNTAAKGPVEFEEYAHFGSSLTSNSHATAIAVDLDGSQYQKIDLQSTTGSATVTLNAPDANNVRGGVLLVEQHATVAADISSWIAGTNIGAVRWLGTEPDWALIPLDDYQAVSYILDGTDIVLSVSKYEGETTAAGGGDNVTVNGAARSDVDLDDATPAAPAGDLNVKWQADSSAPDNVSAYVDVSVLEPLLEVANLAAVGTIDFGGAAFFEIPNAAAPVVTGAAGRIAVDTTVASYDGLIKYYDGTTEMAVVAVPVADLTTTDNDVVAYATGKSGFNMEAQAASGGGSLTPVSKDSTDGEYTASANERVSYDVSGGAELVTDGSFAVGSGWTFGTGWTHDATNDDADAGASTSSDLERAITVTNGTKYVVRFRIRNYVGGTVTPKLASTSGTARSADGYYKEVIQAGAGPNIQFTASGFEGDIDDVSVVIQMAVRLPIAANVSTGDVIVVHCKTGDADGSVQVLTGASLDLIDGVDHFTNEKTNLFVTGESMSFICVDGATGDYETLQDNRKKCTSKLDRNGSNQTGVTDNGYDDIELNNAAYDVGDVANTTEFRFMARRSSKVRLNGMMRPSVSITASSALQFLLCSEGDTNPANELVANVEYVRASTATTTHSRIVNGTFDATEGDIFRLRCFINFTATGGINGSTKFTYLEFDEIG